MNIDKKWITLGTIAASGALAAVAAADPTTLPNNTATIVVAIIGILGVLGVHIKSNKENEENVPLEPEQSEEPPPKPNLP